MSELITRLFVEQPGYTVSVKNTSQQVLEWCVNPLKPCSDANKAKTHHLKQPRQILGLSPAPVTEVALQPSSATVTDIAIYLIYPDISCYLVQPPWQRLPSSKATLTHCATQSATLMMVACQPP